MGCLVRKLTGCCLVYYSHGDAISIQQLASGSILGKLKISLMRMVEKVFLPRTDLVVTVSTDIESRFLERVHMDHSRIHTVPNNVLTYRTQSLELISRLKNSGLRIVGYVGHFSILKGLETLVLAFDLLKKQCNNIRLILVGDGPTRKHLEALVTQRKLQDKVVFTGWVSNPLDYMTGFDILVVPSLYEACPSVVLEAFSLDVPVLGTRVGGMPELLFHDELMFCPKDYKELAFRLKGILSSYEEYSRIKRLISERRRAFTFCHTEIIERLFLKKCYQEHQSIE